MLKNFFEILKNFFEVLKNFCGKIFRISRRFRVGRFQTGCEKSYFEENMTNSLIGDVIQVGVCGEKEVLLGLSRPLDGLMCPIKLLPVRIALILA